MSIITTVALLLFLTVPEVISQGYPVNLRCQCIIKEKKPIGRYIEQVEVNPASSHCNDLEIIATLKRTGQKICLDPDAPWVKKVLEKTRVQQAP